MTTERDGRSSDAEGDAAGVERAAEPYGDGLEHLFDELRRLDLLLGRLVEAMWAESDGTVDEYRGLYVSDEDVERILGRTDGEQSRRRNFESTAEIEHLGDTIRRRKAASREAGVELRFATVAERFALGPRERDALLVALAPEIDLGYQTLYSYLQDDVTKKRPTVDLVLELLCFEADDRDRDRVDARRLFGQDAPLVRERLLAMGGVDEGVPLISRPLSLDDRIVEYLLGDDGLDRALTPVADLRNPRRARGPLPFDDDVQTALRRLSAAERPAMAYVHGRYGSGRRAVADAVGRERGTPLLRLSAASVPDGPAEFAEALERTRREALLCGASIHVAGIDARPDAEREGAVERLDAFPGAVVFTGEEPWQPRYPSAHAFAAVELGVPDYEKRRAFWVAALGVGGDSDGGDGLGAVVDADVDVDGLAATFRLTGGQIRDVVAAARDLSTGRYPSNESLYRLCREQSRRELDVLARPVDSRYGWDDIVLPADTERHLREVAARIAHRGRVYDVWGFEEKFSLGNGLVVLFTGASGTGKTMAAEIIARDAGLDLYKVDLASVVSKYIGETEKNLRAIFDEAETGDAILLFDEADALFGKRSEVRDSHDRYANVEVDYLLQRIEEHDGTVVLTTNFEQNIDEAFLRRIHLSVDFPFPDAASRLRIWRHIFPAATPVDEVDYEFLSGFEFTGGNIKNVALTAAFMAADGGGPVEMKHLVWALRREFEKVGTLIDPEAFEEYREWLP